MDKFRTTEHKYDNIINLPHHKSKKRKPMPIEDRAAQFGAFRALTGYEDEVAEAARITDEKAELDEYAKAEINAKLQYIKHHTDDVFEVTVTYFVPDSKKTGGSYVTKSGVIIRINEYERKFVFEDGTEIPADDIVSIEGKRFYEIDYMI